MLSIGLFLNIQMNRGDGYGKHIGIIVGYGYVFSLLPYLVLLVLNWGMY